MEKPDQLIITSFGQHYTCNKQMFGLTPENLHIKKYQKSLDTVIHYGLS